MDSFCCVDFEVSGEKENVSQFLDILSLEFFEHGCMAQFGCGKFRCVAHGQMVCEWGVMSTLEDDMKRFIDCTRKYAVYVCLRGDKYASNVHEVLVVDRGEFLFYDRYEGLPRYTDGKAT